MKMELVATTEEESSSPNNSNQFTSREKMQKLLGLCLIRQKLLLINHEIGADFDLLKQTLAGCFVRVPIRGRPMLAAIRSLKDSCQIEWAKFGRRLRLSDSLGYFEFDEVDPAMPGQDEMERWCQRREQKGSDPLSDEFITEKLAQLNKITNETDEPAKAEPQSAEENVSICSGMEKENTENDDISADENEENDEFGEDEEGISVKAEQLPELPNVEGLVQSRELLAQVLLPSDEFLKFFIFRNKSKVEAFSLATAGCLLAFRIAGTDFDTVIVDEIVSVKPHEDDPWKPCHVHCKLRRRPVNAYQLVAVGEEEVTDQVFDQWLQRLAVKDEPVPDVQAKYARKRHALAHLQATYYSNPARKKSQQMTRQLVANSNNDQNAEWAQQIVRNGLPDIGPIIVTARELEVLTKSLELDELKQVLVGCFVSTEFWQFGLELKKQPKMRARFVLPITQVLLHRKKGKDMNRYRRLELYFNSSTTTRIPILHRETGKRLEAARTQNVSDQRLDGAHKRVVQSLLMMRELNIPWPRDEEIARKSAELNAALAKAASFSSSHSSTSSTFDEKPLHQLPGSSGIIKNVLLHHSRPNQPAQTKQKRQKKRRQNGIENDGDAGEKRQRSDI